MTAGKLNKELFKNNLYKFIYEQLLSSITYNSLSIFVFVNAQNLSISKCPAEYSYIIELGVEAGGIETGFGIDVGVEDGGVILVEGIIVLFGVEAIII